MEESKQKFIISYSSLEKKQFSQENSEDLLQIQVEKTDKGLSLSKSGRVFWTQKSVVLCFSHLETPEKISRISCNKTSSLLLSFSGLVYSFGSDPSEFGFLGTKKFLSEKIELIKDLSNIVSISLGKTQAAALDNQGSFYIWGKCPSTNNSLTPYKHNFDIEVSAFECGENFILINTLGGYVYIIGKMGHAHKTSSENNSPVSVPNELEKFCVVDAKASKNFVVCVVESGELFVFDGCLELVKLPLRHGLKIEKVFVIKETIFGIFENYLIQWKMSFNDKNECSLYSFNGIGYQMLENFDIIGRYCNNILVSSFSENPVKDKADVFSPYKITEFGQKLIEKARKSVNISREKFEFIVNSFESCSEIKEHKKFSEKNIKNLVFALNRIVKNYFFGVLDYCRAKKFRKKFFCGGLPYVAAKLMKKKILSSKHRVLNVFRLNFEKKNVFNEFFLYGFDVLSEIIKKIKAKNFFYCLKGLINAKVIYRSVICIEKVQKTHARACFHEIKRLLAASKVVSFLIKKALENLKKGLKSVKVSFFNEKSSKILAKILKKREKFKLFRVFGQMKKNYHKNCIEDSVSLLRLSQQLDLVSEILKQAKLRQEKGQVVILFDINSFYPLKSLLKSQFKKLLKFLIPKSESFALFFQKSVTKAVLREKLLIFNQIIPSFYHSADKDFTFLSPIKNPEKKDLHERYNTLDFPLDYNSIEQNPSNSIENNFKKYLLWRTECKSVVQKDSEKESKKPPWKPSGNNFKVFDDESVVKACVKRKEYSESIRSSQSSMSSEESFCKKSGWEKWDYFNKIKTKKTSLLRLVGLKFLAKTLNFRITQDKKHFFGKIKKVDTSKNRKNSNPKSWKMGLYTIGILKFVALAKRKYFSFFWSKLAKV